MKKVALIIGLFCLTSTSFADNSNINSASACEYVNNQLKLNAPSKVVIKDKAGNVVFYCEEVKNLDVANWQGGTYVVNINDKTNFEFTIKQNLMAYNLKK